MTWGKLPVLRTAAGHYPDEEHINCAYVTFAATSVNLVVKYDKRFDLVFSNILKRKTNNRSVGITVVVIRIITFNNVILLERAKHKQLSASD